MIYKISDMDKVKTHDSVITQYMVNENPGFKIKWI